MRLRDSLSPPVRGHAAGVRHGALALAAALVALVGSCSSLDARTHNLRQLHQEDGKVSYWADLIGDGEYVLRDAFSVQGPFGLDLSLRKEELDEEFIPDPA